MKFIKKHKYIFITFGLSFLVINLLYLMNGVLPYGKNSLLTVDFYYQYGPLLNELVDRIKEGGSFLFSFNDGLGIPFFRNFFNYLSSPLNIILFLFKQKNILTAFSVIIGLKACLSSTFLAYYLKKTFKKDNLFICIFGLLYGFSSYFVAYYWNLMWLDGMMLLPIICLGINKLIDKNKISLYVISLVLMLFSNYFIGYMICIFCVFYFFMYLILTNKFKLKLYLKKCLLFLFASLLVGAISAFFLIPMFTALKSISATGDSFRFSTYFNFNFLYLIPNSLSGVIPTVFSNGTSTTPIPNIACGFLPLICSLMLFFNKDISIKKKIVFSVLLLLFIFSFNFKPIDFIWHGFHVPNDLPYRYSFIYIFLIIIFGYYSLLKMKSVKPVYVISIFVILFISAVIFYFTNYFNFNSENIVYILLCLFIYFLVYLIYKLKAMDKLKFQILLTVLTMIEIVAGIDINWNITQDGKDFMKDYQSYKYIIDDINENDNSFYRMERNSFKTLNDGSWYNYNGISTFSSVAYEDVSILMRDIGLGGNYINSYYYQPNTPIFDMIFSLKYTFEYRNDNPLYIYHDKYDIPVYEFPFSINPVFAVNKDLYDWNTYGNPFEIQKDFIYKSTGISDVLYKINSFEIIDNNSEICDYNGSYILLNDNTDNITITINNEDNTYIYIYNEQIDYFTINEDFYYPSANEPYILDAGKREEETTINIYFKDLQNRSVEFYAYKLDNDKFIESYNYFKNNEIKIDNYTDTSFSGTINIDEDKLVFTSLAFDEGWNVYIDDEKVDTFKIGKALLGFEISKGSHKIKLVYEPVGLKLGIIISSISLIIFISYLIIKKELIRK